MTKKAMIKEESPGVYSIYPEWEEVGRGEFVLVPEPEEPSAGLSTEKKVRTKEIQPGLYEILE